MASPYKIQWSHAAQKDLEAAMEYVAMDSPATALKLFHSIRLKASSLKNYPARGRHLPEFAHLRGMPFRELVMTPWRLIYRIRKTTVEVLAFFDGRRDLEEILYERLSRFS